MALPQLEPSGDLPVGVHEATLAEVLARFGTGSPERRAVSDRLARVWELATATGALDRLIVFGSYVTDKAEPNDVDVVLLMRDDFELSACPPLARALFDHLRAADELGASVFWARPGMLFGEPVEEFVASWQVKRGGGRRGIVEVRG
ncbi:MAG TPA: hypothetical protein VFG68_06745 [Fimbriiglobus sp.]|nr:hypothetical protein [Fimbriiglobus sp.]